MSTTLTFLGATRTVTGSRYLLETPEAKILIDAGMFQDRAFLGLNWENYGLDPRRIDAVLLTHGHMDHSGWLPKLVKDGFRGPVYTTPATADLVPIIVRDIAAIQTEDAKNKAKRHAREGRTDARPPAPLYNADDAEKAIACLRPIAALGKTAPVAPGVTAQWGENGHILGASWIAVETGGRRIVFSGDVGRWDRPILNDPLPPAEADYLLIESTYGDREHPGGELDAQMAEAVEEAAKRGGNLIIPSFSVERSQELLYSLSTLAEKGRLPFDGVYLDSPMASRVTDLFRKHPEVCDEEMLARMQSGHSPFAFRELQYLASAEDSKRLNGVRSGAIIIAGNGMCTGGRVKHHLFHGLEHATTTVLFVGFQAPGTLGRELVDGRKEVRLFNRPVKVNASIRQLYGLSGHADRKELLRWAGVVGRAPRHCFVTHGEQSSSEALASSLRERYGWMATVPSKHDKVTLE